MAGLSNWSRILLRTTNVYFCFLDCLRTYLLLLCVNLFLFFLLFTDSARAQLAERQRRCAASCVLLALAAADSRFRELLFGANTHMHEESKINNVAFCGVSYRVRGPGCTHRGSSGFMSLRSRAPVFIRVSRVPFKDGRECISYLGRTN